MTRNLSGLHCHEVKQASSLLEVCCEQHPYFHYRARLKGFDKRLEHPNNSHVRDALILLRWLASTASSVKEDLTLLLQPFSFWECPPLQRLASSWLVRQRG